MSYRTVTVNILIYERGRKINGFIIFQNKQNKRAFIALHVALILSVVAEDTNQFEKISQLEL